MPSLPITRLSLSPQTTRGRPPIRPKSSDARSDLHRYPFFIHQFATPPLPIPLSNITIVDHPDGATLQVRVKPRASRSAILEPSNGILVVALAAPPVDGEANAELFRLLAHVTRHPKTQIRLVSGQKARLKTLQFQGIHAADLRHRLDAASMNSP